MVVNAKIINLKNDKNIFEAVSQAFPEIVEQSGTGFGQEIYVKNLTCVSNQDEDECQIIPFEGESIKIHTDGSNYPEDEVVQLKIQNIFNAIIQGGFKPTVTDIGDGIGIKQISLNFFDCARIEPKPSKPTDLIKPEFSCSYKK